MKKILLTKDETNWVNKLIGEASKRAKDISARNPCTVGGVEILLGAGCIALGVKLGAIEMGANLVGTAGQFNIESLLGASGGGIAGTALSIIGGIGIAGMGSAIGIPAALLGIGGAAVGAIAGYSVGDVVHNLLNPSFGILDFIQVGSLLAIGTALLVDGCRRIIGSEAFRANWSSFQNGVLNLVQSTSKIVCRSVDDVCVFLRGNPLSGFSAMAGGVVGAAVGTSVAASTVTVLGSHLIGGAALSLGLVSAPLWPVIACGIGGAALGFGAWRFLNRGSGGSGPKLLDGPTINI